MAASTPETLLLAQAVYDIRLLLSKYLGSVNEGPLEVRQAAHLAYALHEQARQLLEGRPFDVPKVLEALRATDKMLNSDFAERMSKLPNARL